MHAGADRRVNAAVCCFSLLTSKLLGEVCLAALFLSSLHACLSAGSSNAQHWWVATQDKALRNQLEKVR